MKNLDAKTNRPAIEAAGYHRKLFGKTRATECGSPAEKSLDAKMYALEVAKKLTIPDTTFRKRA
jgi:hypothetical protein